MRTKKILSILFLSLIFIAACDDDLSEVGMGVQPDQDQISVYDTTILINSYTVKIDSIYAKSITGYLGEIYDPSYGTLKSGYACQYYPSYGFYIDSIIGNKIDSVKLVFYYNTFWGDSLAPMEVSVYPVVKTLEKNYYTNINPADFCDMQNPIVRRGYTARNPLTSDSLVNLGYYRSVTIPLPNEFGQRFLDEAMKPEPNAFSSVNAFTEFFPGTYLSTTFGVGSMIAAEYTRLHVYYTRNYTVEDSEGNDSIIVAMDYADFRVTKEVVQLNSIQNNDDSFLLESNKDSTFIKSPAGVYTKIVIPIREIAKKIGKRKFSGIELSVKAYPQNDWEFGFDYPGLGAISKSEKSKLLLINADSIQNFFETQSVADNLTTYATTFNWSEYAYKFNNISNVVQHAIENAPEKDLNLLLIPIQTSYMTESTYNGYVDRDYASSYYLSPSAVALKKGGDNLKIRIIASDLTINN